MDIEKVEQWLIDLYEDHAVGGNDRDLYCIGDHDVEAHYGEYGFVVWPCYFRRSASALLGRSVAEVE